MLLLIVRIGKDRGRPIGPTGQTGLACAVRVDLDLLLGIFYKSTREVLRLLRPIYMLNKDNVCCGLHVTNAILDH
jgi:hypothetical protein